MLVKIFKFLSVPNTAQLWSTVQDSIYFFFLHLTGLKCKIKSTTSIINKLYALSNKWSRVCNYTRSTQCSNNKSPWYLENIVPWIKTFIRIIRYFIYVTSEWLWNITQISNRKLCKIFLIPDSQVIHITMTVSQPRRIPTLQSECDRSTIALVAHSTQSSNGMSGKWLALSPTAIFSFTKWVG